MDQKEMNLAKARILDIVLEVSRQKKIVLEKENKIKEELSKIFNTADKEKVGKIFRKFVSF